MDLSNYTIEQLVELKDEISNQIYSFEDGYFYICKINSYGRSWEEKGITNPYTLQELCYQYDGGEGIINIYTNNPDLNVVNYGDVKFVPTRKDYEKWYKYSYLKRQIPNIEKELEEWENRDNVPFSRRPLFAPIYSHETVEEYKKEMSELEGTFVEPVNIRRYAEEEEE